MRDRLLRFGSGERGSGDGRRFKDYLDAGKGGKAGFQSLGEAREKVGDGELRGGGQRHAERAILGGDRDGGDRLNGRIGGRDEGIEGDADFVEFQFCRRDGCQVGNEKVGEGGDIGSRC